MENKLIGMLDLMVWELSQNNMTPQDKLAWLENQIALYHAYEKFVKTGGK